jgi:hypothetical protein
MAVTALPLSPPDVPLFRTRSSAFVAACLAANQLTYRGAELCPTGNHVEFLLEDPQGIGPDLLARYNAGVFPFVNPKLLMDVRGHLIAQVNRLQGKGVAGGNR